MGKETIKEKKEEKKKPIQTKPNREYLKIIKSQAMLMTIFLGATLIELVFLMFNQDNFDQKIQRVIMLLQE